MDTKEKNDHGERMLTANKLFNSVKSIRLQGLKKAGKVDGVCAHIDVTAPIVEDSVLRVRYNVTLKLGALLPASEYAYREVEMGSVNSEFLVGACIDLGMDMQYPYAGIGVRLQSPLQYLSYAIGGIIAERSALVISLKENSISFELVCHLSKELRRRLGRGHQTTLPRMKGACLLGDLKQFFRPKSASRKRTRHTT